MKNDTAAPGNLASRGSQEMAGARDADAPLLELVANQPFFKGLKEEHLRLLSESAMVTEFKADEWIFRQGDPANRFYLILEGKVKIESEIKEHGLVPIRTLGAGDDLAWAWLFPPYYMHFSARAIERTRAIFFYGTRLREQCETNHELGYQLMKRIAEIVVRNLNATQTRLLEFACTEKPIV
jgi:CRP-like cAMP-binding protein